MFKLKSLIIDEKMKQCEKGKAILKILKPGEYNFYNSNFKLPSNFFGKKISVHTLVGMNGSGKSSLLDLIYRILNNVGFAIMRSRKIPQYQRLDLNYVKNIYASIRYSIDDIEGKIVVENEKLTISYGRGDKWNFDLNNGESAVISYNNGLSSNLELLASKFFYTIVANYSIQAFISSDYESEECEDMSPFYSEKKTWIDKIFYKNDGYTTPIVLNPYRENGSIYMDREKKLNTDRVGILFYFLKKKKNKDFLDGYEFARMGYKFNSDGLLKKIKTIENSFTSWLEKNQHIIRDFIASLKSDNSFAKEILNHYNLYAELVKVLRENELYDKIEDYAHYMDIPYFVGCLYLLDKIQTMVTKKYPEFDFLYDNENQNKVAFMNKMKNQTVLIVDSSQINEDEKTILNSIYDALEHKSHVTMKFHRVIRYLQTIYPEFKERKDFNLVDYAREVPCDTPEKYLYAMPPSFFKPTIYLKKKNDTKEIPIDLISAGEKQYINMVGTFAYHILNVLSIKNEDNVLHYGNISCIIDEAELSFHPEFQKEFVYNFVNVIDYLGLNDDEISFDILIATHSPFILSDIPSSNILYLEKGESKDVQLSTFAANVSDILTDSFFLGNGFTGKFAQEKINMAVKNAIATRKSSIKHKELKRKELDEISDLIGDEILKSAIKYLLKNQV